MNKTTTILIIVSSVLCIALASPMLYKRNEHDKYEPDLVPVSSTVIPLTVYEVSYGLGGKPSEEYKEAYLKKLRKKVKHDEDEDPDTLITIKKKYHDTEKLKESVVKGV